MSEKDTVKQNIENNISPYESHIKSSINLFKFSKLKSKAKIILSDYNFFNYNFDTKTLIDFNNKEKDSIYRKENNNLNTIKNINIELPSINKINEIKFFNEFIDTYDTSFAHFCEIDKKKFIKAFQNKLYIPYIDKFGNIKISIKNLLDLLKTYSHSLKLKIRRRFIKKYKKKKIFKTFHCIKLNNNKNNKNILGINNNKENTTFTSHSNNNNNNEGLKLISLKKNLKISVKKNNNMNNINNNNNSSNKVIENNENNNNIMNNNLILSNNLIKNENEIFFSNNYYNNNLVKSSLFNVPLTNENIFSFSLKDQDKFNINISDILNKKITYTPLPSYTPYNNNINNINNNANIQNTSNKKNNNNNFNLNFNIATNNINPHIFSPSPLQDFLSPNSYHFPQSNLSSPLINDKFTFNNMRNNIFYPGNLNNLNNINNPNFAVINNMNINPNIFNLSNNFCNKNDNSNIILSPNLINSINNNNNLYKK